MKFFDKSATWDIQFGFGGRYTYYEGIPVYYDVTVRIIKKRIIEAWCLICY